MPTKYLQIFTRFWVYRVITEILITLMFVKVRYELFPNYDKQPAESEFMDFQERN